MNERVLIQQHNPRTGAIEYMVKYLAAPRSRTRRFTRRRSTRRASAPAAVALSAEIERLSPDQLRRKREGALRTLRRGDGDRDQAAATLLLTDQALARTGDAFEDRLASAKEAIGRTPSREDEQIQQEAAAVRLSMQSGPTQPDVAARARAMRAAMEGTERDLPFEARLQAARKALGR